MLVQQWWEEFPGRLEFEVEALEGVGAKILFVRKDEKSGSAHVQFEWRFAGETFNLQCVFPPLYPYFRPEVFGVGFLLPRHQNPVGGNLCFLPRGSYYWQPSDTVAWLLTEQFPKVVRAAKTENETERRSLEVPQGEPVSAFYEYAPGAILYDSNWAIPSEVGHGRLDIVLNSLRDGFQGAITRISRADGKVLQSDDRLGSANGKRLHGRWSRLKQVLRESKPEHFLKELQKENPKFSAPDWQRVNGELSIDVIGMLVREEGQQGVFADGWIFIVRARQGKSGTTKSFLIRGGRAGESDSFSRIPNLSFLRSSKIALAGLGGIGAPAALELLRAGVGQLGILDHDYVEAGTAVRWPFGFASAGLRKTDVLKRFASENYPYSKVLTYQLRIGGLPLDSEQRNERTVLEDFTSADLVLDATAEPAIHRVFAKIAQKRDIPHVMGYATNGGVGGLVARFTNDGSSGCWLCLEKFLEDGTITPPPAIESAIVQPFGCGDITYTAAGFDISEISNQAVRLSVATLAKRNSGTYPIANWDVAVLALRDEFGNSIPPSWKTYSLGKHPNCSCDSL